MWVPGHSAIRGNRADVLAKLEVKIAMFDALIVGISDGLVNNEFTISQEKMPKSEKNKSSN